ncbi:MAG: WD40/YVTN/BNR-like repeat-containing protein [Acidimicrobiales bacterium]
MTERRAQDPPSQRDAEITLLLQDVAVPDHRHGFWDDLARQMEQTDQPSRIGPALGNHVAGADAEPAPAPEPDPTEPRSIAPLAWRLLAAAVVLALVGGVALLRSGPDNERVDSGVTTTAEIEGADPEPASTGDPASTSTVRGGKSWLFAEEIAWIGDEFVTSGLEGRHWTSPDGIEWQRREGEGPVLHRSVYCPQELTCAVAPEAPPIPFHYSDVRFLPVARVGDVVLLETWTMYSVEQPREWMSASEQDRQPVLHPDLLAAAAASDPCFAELAQQDPSETSDGARLVSWDRSGPPDPIIQLTCTRGSDTAVFELDLREHLDDAQLEALFSDPGELWVESPTSPPERVDDFPTTSRWSDGEAGRELTTWTSPVESSGDRFWAVDEGTLVSSTDGTDWTAHEVPTAGSEIDHVAASSGGHLALVLVEDRRVCCEEGEVIVSHDGGSSWSEPVEVQIGGFPELSVGPAGAALSSDAFEAFDAESLTPGENAPVNITSTVAIVATDRTSVATVSYTFSDGNAVGPVAVGADRVLVWANGQADVYGLDGTLLHRTTWVGGLDWARDLRWGLALAAAAAVALALVALARRRRNRAAADQLH